jgi:hypothetical protein
MRKALWTVVFGLALVGCGSRESTTTTGAGTPDVSAVQPGASPEAAAQAANCRSLVDAGKYAEAADVCREAVASNPGDAGLEAALAKASAANMASSAGDAASAAAGAAVEGAKDAAGAVADAASDAAEATADAANAAVEGAKDAADATGEAAKDAADATGDAAKDAADAVTP